MSPASPVTVSVARTEGDTNLVVTAGTNLIFNSGSWNVSQEVTLFAEDDTDTGNGTATISCSSPGATTKMLTATEIDDDIVALIVSPYFMQIPEGSNQTFTVRLSAIPLDNSTVLVTRVSGDTNLSVVSGSSLVFSSGDWQVDQTTTVACAADADHKNGDAIFRCEPQFPNTKGSVDVVALEVDSGLAATSFRDGENEYVGTADSYISDWAEEVNYGTAPSAYLEPQRKPLIQWELTSLSSAGTIESATIQLAQ